MGEVIVVLAIFLGGVVFGVVVVVSMAIRRDEQRSTLTRRSALSRNAPDAAARLLAGVGSSNAAQPAEQDHRVFGIPGHWDDVHHGVSADGQPRRPGDSGIT